MMDLKERIDTVEAQNLQARIAKLPGGYTIRMNGWKIWRNKENAVVDGLLVKVDCVWVESPQGRYSMFRGFDIDKVERMLDLMAEKAA